MADIPASARTIPHAESGLHWHHHWKTVGVPEYVVSESGPDHEKTFTAAARVGGVEYGTGTGRSKKEAEQQAAEAAWRSIREAAAPSAEKPAQGTP